MQNTGKHDGLIFDLDGTLWDSSEACAEGWNRALSEVFPGARKLTAEDLGRIMGLTFVDAVKLLIPGISDDRVQEIGEVCFKKEIEAIRESGGGLFPGVGAGLQKLKSKYPLFLVSNCLEDYLSLFLELQGFGTLFEDTECFGRTQRTKDYNIKILVERNGLKSPAYIGDTSTDQRACQANQIPYYHMDYGFGEPVAPCQRFGTFDEMVEYFL